MSKLANYFQEAEGDSKAELLSLKSLIFFPLICGYLIIQPINSVRGGAMPQNCRLYETGII